MPLRATLVALVLPAFAVAADPPDLRIVPADSAVFLHLDVAAVWDSKLGETVRSAKARDLDAGLAYLKSLGVTPDMVKAVTFYVPQLKGPADSETFGVLVSFRKPYDRAALLDGLKKRKVKVTDRPDGSVNLALTDGTEKDDKDGRSTLTLVTPDATHLAVFSRIPAEKWAAKPAGSGPIRPALQAAAEGAAVAAGFTMGSLPDELRSDDLPPEARAFQPIAKADAVILAGKLTADALTLDLRVRTAGNPADAEKSLAVGVQFLQAALMAAATQVEKGKEEDAKPLAALVRQAGEVLKGAKIGTDGADATARLVAKLDLGFGPLLRQMFGEGGPADKASSAASRARCQNNLKQLGLAMHNYEAAFGVFPPAAVVDKKGRPLLSWRVAVLPYVGQAELYKQFKLDEPWDSPHNKKVFDENPMPTVFALPGVTPDGGKLTHFRVFAGGGAMFDPVIPTRLAGVTDGLSNTILIPTAKDAVPWTKPDELKFDPTGNPLALMGDHYGGGFNVTFGDGSVRFIKTSIDATVFKALITRSGGEVVGDF
ncbi:MAG: DUF1559 domain-containing protein [Gemmataceae bacterium]